MSKSTTKAEKILNLIEKGLSVETIKDQVSSNLDEWHKYSSKAYNISFEKVKKERKNSESKKFESKASSDQIDEILSVNDQLSDYGLLLNIFTTHPEVEKMKELLSDYEKNEVAILQYIERITMHPRLRVLQKKGRITQFDYFKDFTKLIDSATLSYYRSNFIGCYLTLIPVIEGIIIRWMGYTENDSKPEFEKIRKFFRKSHLRQPNPTNILFHKVYTEVCDKIINNHFFKPTSAGKAYKDYNRHIASHLLNNNEFATKDNCLRLFILIDAMTEIYFYESKKNDPRFSVSNHEISEEIELFTKIMITQNQHSPENILLNDN